MIDLTIKEIDPKTRSAIVEAPDGSIVQLIDPLPDHFVVGGTIGIDEAVWEKWQKFWASGPPIAQWVEMSDLKKHTYNNKVWIPLYAQHKISAIGEVGHEGFREEYFGTHSVIV